MVRREYYLLSPSGQTLGILDIETDTWTYYINGASRIAKVTPEVLQQPDKFTGVEISLGAASYYITDHLGNTRAVYSATVDCPAIFYTLE